jgi:6-pyruvoyltetrahydropterin/6-carboxytetrahydropterin synthase
MDLKDLSIIIKEKVIEPLDHKNLNLDVPFLSSILPSTENLVIEVWNQLEKSIETKGGVLCYIKILETENNFVEYYGGKEPF